MTVTARRTKADGAKTSEVQQSIVSSRDGGVVFRILNQPETQHRARSNIFFLFCNLVVKYFSLKIILNICMANKVLIFLTLPPLRQSFRF